MDFIQLPGGDSHINATDVLAEAQQMPAPQDLRFAIFYVSAAQKAPAILKKDVDELRKRCIVQADQSKPSSCFHITFSNGVAIKMSTHACYPNVSVLCCKNCRNRVFS